MIIEIENILNKYTKKDYKIFFDTVETLCSKGISKGVYQDYTVLIDVVSILTICESIIKSK